jgi:ribosomal protein S18 acetylase RimI-like enzyme
MSLVKLIQAAPVHSDQLEQLAKTTFIETYGSRNPQERISRYVNESFNPKVLLAELKDPLQQYVLAEVDHVFSGYMKLKPGMPEGYDYFGLEICRFYLLSALHGKGIADEMMAYCEEYARTKSLPLLWLSAWQHNPRAIRFYEKKGFEKKGDLIFRMVDDDQRDFLMIKHL